MQRLRSLESFPASLYGTDGGKRPLFAQAVFHVNNTSDSAVRSETYRWRRFYGRENWSCR